MELIWSSIAESDFYNMIEDVETNFGGVVANKVSDRLLAHISLLENFPRIGVYVDELSSEENEVRYLLNSPNYIFYSITASSIFILSILDCRMSPEHIRQHISLNLIKD